MTRYRQRRIGTRKRRIATVVGILLLAASLAWFTFKPSQKRIEQEIDPYAEFALGVSDGASPIGEQIERETKAVWTGDLDGMIERRQIRVLVVHNKLFYFLDGGHQRGATYETFTEFERFVNKLSDKGKRKIHVVFIPVTRNELLPALASGRGDIAAANLTITPDRLELVDFADPHLEGVAEIVVTHKDEDDVDSVEALSGRTLYVRPSSSYYQSVLALNEHLESLDKEPLELVLVDGSLEDGDLLEMVNAGLLPLVIVDSHKAAMWAQVFPDIIVHDNVSLREDSKIAWAFRKGSPKLEQALNRFVAEHRKGTLFGNIVFDRYLQNNEWIKNPLAEAERRRLDSMVDLFKHYGDRYDFDWLMLAALAYQESRLDQSKRSEAGAIGVMQMLESTASDPQVDIDNIHKLENNIHAGTKYLHVLQQTYLDDPGIDPLNKTLLTFASYNAGPSRSRAIRTESAENGFDPNRWFNHVEVLVARYVG
ncbi:MAG: lytic transglycosylase F, partial [Proteobacteria bacterium]